MDSHTTALTYEEVIVAKAAIRVFRLLASLAVAVMLPVAVVLAMPLLGGLLLAGVLAAPLLVAWVLLSSSRRDGAARSPARA